ncbi:MAG: hypothetical protein RI841_16025 [Halomonas sp.]|uniref:hypothetical protein n=1 Tax=Halomonas sp. TaxID=1486246 RepID=UPI00287042C3|nr:hypothetical protein [Halomonas sp.]MDR9440987.1 hypothetical protein [Halomonas sp.]
MDSSLLVSLRQYRPLEGRDSLENFITEVFAWLLHYASGVSEAVLTCLQRAMPESEGFDLPFYSEEIEWDTQARLVSRRPDMQATWPGRWPLYDHGLNFSPTLTIQFTWKRPCSKSFAIPRPWRNSANG